MNLVFAGTPDFALTSLTALHAAGHRILAVYTQPDRPAGRGRQLAESPVKCFATQHALALRQPVTLADAARELAALAPDAVIVVAYGLLLPAAVLAVPKLGCLNVHASLLPRWRGAAPVARAIEAGDTETGVCIMQMEAGLDTGPVFDCRPTAIGDTETAGTLEARLAGLGADLLVETLRRIERERLAPHPQAPRGATYARKLRKDEAMIDWQSPAAVIHRKIRALNPWPVAHTTWGDRVLRLWEVAPLGAPERSSRAPGSVLRADAAGLCVQAGDGPVTITCLQAQGGRALAAREFLNGHRIAPGDYLGPAAAPR